MAKVKSKGMGIKNRHRRGFQKKGERDPRGVVYLSHIPHGFYKEQIEGYFNQFGKVTGVNVPRSKSGRSKGYAFIEFKYPEVAQIAADTMNNYFMMNRLVKAKFISSYKQKPHIFRKAKEACENQDTQKNSELNIKLNRKVKNRCLKTLVEVKFIKRLLEKRNLLTKRMLKFKLSPDFEVEEGDCQSVCKQPKE